MSGKRECKIYTKTFDAEDECGPDRNMSFILRKGRSILSQITKDKDVNHLVETTLADSKAFFAENPSKQKLSCLARILDPGKSLRQFLFEMIYFAYMPSQ